MQTATHIPRNNDGTVSGARGMILLYHRVARLERDPQLLSVTPGRFAQHLEWLKPRYTIVHLRELPGALRRSTNRERFLAVTFDDGYRDNLTHAAPILRDFNVPATVFVTTGFLVGDREFWWDELERILLSPVDLPRKLETEIAGKMCDWDLRDSADAAAIDWSIAGRWNVLNPSPAIVRHQLYRWLCRELRPLSDPDRLRVLADLRAWAGAESFVRDSRRVCSEADLVELARGGLIDIGAHTVTHPVLSTLSPERQHEEISQSKGHLESVLRRRVAAFSFPFGTPADITPETLEITRAAGFSLAVINAPGHVTPASDAYALPRVLVRNVPNETLARQISVHAIG